MRRRLILSFQNVHLFLAVMCVLTIFCSNVVALHQTGAMDKLENAYRHASSLAELKTANDMPDRFSSNTTVDAAQKMKTAGNFADASAEFTARMYWHNFNATFRNLHFNYRMTAPARRDNACNAAQSGDDPIFVFVPTRAEAFERRAAIRNSWATHNSTRATNMIVRFVVGRTRDPIISELLFLEFRTANDFIIYDIPDTYENLFLKVYAAFQWQRKFCRHARFVLKTDDDTIVHLGRLKFWLDEVFDPFVRQKNSLALFGIGLLKNRPIRMYGHKWYVPYEAFPNTVFPPYVTGATYLLTSPAVKVILNAATRFNVFAIEDALFTGLLATSAGVRKFDASNFFRGGYNNSEIFDYEKCDKRNEPFVFSLYGFPYEEFFDRYERILSAKCIPARFYNSTELQPFVEI